MAVLNKRGHYLRRLRAHLQMPFFNAGQDLQAGDFIGL